MAPMLGVVDSLSQGARKGDLVFQRGPKIFLRLVEVAKGKANVAQPVERHHPRFFIPVPGSLTLE